MSRLWLESVYAFQEGAEFILQNDGTVLVSVSDEQARDSYNVECTSKFTATREQAEQLRDWLCENIGPVGMRGGEMSRDAGIWDAILDNPISDNGHRFGCPACEETGECHCDKPYRLQRRIIMSAVACFMLAALVWVVRWLAVDEPELGKKVAEYFGVGAFAIAGFWLFGLIVYSIGTLLQKWFWR